jgi:hypothetical protein
MLIVIILLFKSFYLDSHSPKKIKTIALITVIAMSLRYAALLILFLAHNIKYLYLLKFLFFMNLIAVPLIAMTALYIFMRGHIINFSYAFIAVVILIMFYSFIMFRCTCFLENYNDFAYTMIFVQDSYIYWIYIVLNTIILFFTVFFINKKNINKIGIMLVIIASLGTIIEYIMWIMGITLLGEKVIGDLLWIITLVYALNKVKK